MPSGSVLHGEGVANPRRRTNHVALIDYLHRRRRSRPARRRLLALMVCLIVVGLVSSCGQESPEGTASLGERQENDVPLNPPTLRFHVSADGQVSASPDREAEAGEVVALALENESNVAYELRLLDPDGDDVFAAEAPADERSGGRATPREVGSHVVTIYPKGKPGAEEEFTVEVSET